MNFQWLQKPDTGFADGIKVLSFVVLLTYLALNDAQAQYVRDSSQAAVPDKTDPVPETDFSQKLVPGGNFGLSLGNPWFLDLSPNLGYQVNERLVSGAGLSYVAYGTRIGNVRFRWERYGGMLFSRYRLFDSFFANAELEMLNVEDEEIGKRVWMVNPLVGGSYIMPFGKRGGLQASLLYNLNYNPSLSPYPYPFFWRIGFFL
jgi:hypothetical protein